MRSSDTVASCQMFMGSPVCAAELSDLSGNGTPWMLGGSSDENIAEGNVMHGDIAAAPQAARVVAERIAAALGHATLPAGDSDTIGRVVVIAGQGGTGVPDKAGLIAALGLKRQVDHVTIFDEASVAAKNYTHGASFCYMNDDNAEDDGDTLDRRCIKAATAIMAADLQYHFELNFSEEIAVAPVLYGGRAADGNVVAVLSMRVWT